MLKRDDRLRDYVLPVRIVASEKTNNAKTLLNADLTQIGLREMDVATVHSGGYVILDFGRELQGGVRILTSGTAGEALVRIRLGESVSECCAELGEKGACNDHSLRDLTIPMCQLSDMQFCMSGFRFARIDVLGVGSICGFKAICAVYVHTSSVRRGSFRCSDELVNRIFDTAAYTVELCMQTYIWDGIKRDRLVWVGDLHPETRAIAALYGNDDIIPRSLDFEKAQSPLPAWMNDFPQYSMWWIIILNDYFMSCGNRAYLEAQKDYFEGLLKQLDKCVFENGDFDFGFNFVDWPTHEQPDEPEGVRSLCKLCALKAENLCHVLGLDDSVAKGIYNKLSRKSDEIIDKKQIAALKYLSHTALTAHEKAVLCEGGAHGFSTFMSSYILSALTDNAGLCEALSAMRTYYGGMLEMGATTFWEDFDIDWMENTAPLTRLPEEGERDIHGDFGKYCYVGFRHSFCHGWSAGVVPFIFDKVLGVESLAEGGKKLRVRPDLGDLTFIEGVVPTAYGDVKIRCDKKGGNVEVKIDAPPQVEIIR